MDVIDIDIPRHVIAEALQKAIEALIQRYEGLGMKATGEWIESLEGVVEPMKGIIRGAKYTEQLVQGRAPGRMPPVDPLQKWVESKLGKSGKEARGIAFAVARKIGQEGTTWYKKGGSDLVEVLQDPEIVRMFYSIVGEHLRVDINRVLVREFRTILES